MMTRALLIGLALAPASAFAQPSPELSQAEIATRHLELGNLLLFGKHYAEAIAEYRAGYALDPQPTFLYNLGQALRLAGDCKGAVASYRSFLRTRPSPERAQLAEHNIELCPEPPPPARPPPARPPPAPPPSAPPPSAPPAAIVATETAAWYRDSIGNTLTLGGAVILLTGAILWLQGGADVGDANTAARMARTTDELLRARAAGQDGESTQTLGGTIFIIGGSLLTAGIVRYALLPEPGGGALVVSGRF